VETKRRRDHEKMHARRVSFWSIAREAAAIFERTVRAKRAPRHRDERETSFANERRRVLLFPASSDRIQSNRIEGGEEATSSRRAWNYENSSIREQRRTSLGSLEAPRWLDDRRLVLLVPAPLFSSFGCYALRNFLCNVDRSRALLRRVARFRATHRKNRSFALWRVTLAAKRQAK